MNKKNIPAIVIVVSSTLLVSCSTYYTHTPRGVEPVKFTIGYAGYETYTPYYWYPGYNSSPGYNYTYWANGYVGNEGLYPSLWGLRKIPDETRGYGGR